MIRKYVDGDHTVIENRKCTACHREDNLIKYTNRINKDGTKMVYFICNPCNTEKRMAWYYNGNQKKQLRLNRRYQIRKELNL